MSERLKNPPMGMPEPGQKPVIRNRFLLSLRPFSHQVGTRCYQENGRNRKGTPSSGIDRGGIFFTRSELSAADDRIYEPISAETVSEGRG